MTDYLSTGHRSSRRQKDVPIALFVGIGAFVFLGIAALILMSFNSPFASSGGRSPKPAAKASKPAPKGKQVSAEDLYGQYQENAAKADGAYKGKALNVDGSVESIGQTDDGKPCLLLGAKQWQPGVKCVFEESRRSELAKVRPQDRVVVHGQCGGCPDAPDGQKLVLLGQCRLVTGKGSGR